MRAAIRLCAALGDLARANRAAKRGEEPAARYGEESLARRRFLRISAGAGIAIGIVLTGKAPALADEAGRAEAWVAANRNRLPKTYERFSTYNITYRRAIYRELDPKARQQLWADHIANYRMTHANLTNEQNAALAKVDARVAQLNTFTTRVREKADPEDERLLQDLTQAFGQDEAIALVAVLGPADKPSPEAANSSNSGVLVTCECSTQYDLCYWPSQSNKVCSQLPSCSVTWDGCGLFYQYGCNGMCVSGCGC
ncbi:bacteriocin fulvocin C-related protein [Microbispora sp. NPDC004025]